MKGGDCVAKKKIAEKRDFKALYEKFLQKIAESGVLSQDAILAQQMKDFERMAAMNDVLWKLIESQGYYFIDEKTGRMVINPAIGTYNKNVSTLLKTEQMIEEKTKGISVVDENKSW